MLDNILGGAENLIANLEFFVPTSRKHRVFNPNDITNGEEKVQNEARNEQVVARDVNQFEEQLLSKQQRKAAGTVGNGFARNAPTADATVPDGSTPLAFLKPVFLR